MQTKFSYLEENRDKLLTLIKHNIDDSDVKEEMKELLSSILSWNGQDKRTAGEISKDVSVAVGKIGCPNCGVTRIGIITSNKCSICGHKILEDHE